MKTIWLMLVLVAVVVNAQRRLALPDPRSCANRVRHATYRDARGVAHSYFFSWEHQPTRNLEVDWLDARNICRRHCMDAVSLETPQENEFIKQRVARGNVRYIWTSGRKCNFNGCDRPDLQPQNINGWFWSGSGAKIGPTTQRNSGDWSNTGGFGQAQPDNREAAQGNDESCLSILNNFYNDGIKWHDVACHHRKPFVCEDSDELLNFVLSRNPGIRF
ncbi:L-selectin [Frieseomelitta varia]|uniref:L-selectin n=1 Tax=Frieseomelitta varia TaxID=561572 RepID=UPI001CB6A13B|nr:L-selectin [Frieseomelitta varia]